MTIASMAMSAATAAASYVSQSQAAKRQSDAAQAAYDSQVTQTKNETTQQSQAAAEQMSERARQAMIETGHLQALAADSGTNGGGSNDRVGNEANFNAGQDVAAMQANASSQQRQMVNQLSGSYAQAVSRTASIQQPSLVGTGLQIAGGALNAYTSQESIKNRVTGGVPGSNAFGFKMPGSPT
ncbi:hypothetical protein KEH56_20660 [Burkholderia cenocepacia]|uniref:virion core protein, T7 gp14 family n=1 Tax=Burkholderia cenocepacia TaxID=95486 RepID=UPI001BA8F9C0|nr:hypothetical protein [Burkholderia cenocepacia]QUN41762.1 hypothetical protein KEH56_20660 [Burkholderia cenocepacia]